jgi:peptide/nickel transport system permease protein
MGRYIASRIIQSIPLLIFIAIGTFLLTQAVGDPLYYLANDPRIKPEEQMRRRALYGIDDPITLKFAHWLFGDDWWQRDLDGDGTGDVYGERRGILRGDFGESLNFDKGKPVPKIFAERLPNTLILSISAYIVTLLISLIVGIYSALNPYTWFDNLITSVGFILSSVPIYLFALILIYFLAVQARLIHNDGNEWLPYFPVQGMRPARNATNSLGELAWHMVLPILTLSLGSIAGYSRFVRSSMLEVINSDYIRTAYSKGLSPRRVNFVHALKNASLPLITLVGLDLPFLLSGAVVTESIFAWRGVGTVFIGSLDPIDPPVIMFFTLMIAVAVAFFSLMTDLIYAALDPRVRFV